MRRVICKQDQDWVKLSTVYGISYWTTTACQIRKIWPFSVKVPLVSDVYKYLNSESVVSHTPHN